MVRIICADATQSGKPDAENERFYEEKTSEWSMANKNELVLSSGDFNGHVWKCAEGFEGIIGRTSVARILQSGGLRMTSHLTIRCIQEQVQKVLVEGM